VDAEGHPADGGQALEQRGKRIAAIRGRDGVEVRRSSSSDADCSPTLNRASRGPTELEPGLDGLIADEVKRFEVPVALGVGQIRSTDAVAGDREQERIGEQKIGVGDSAQEIVADAELRLKRLNRCSAKQWGQVTGPHFCDRKTRACPSTFAGEQALHAADALAGGFAAGYRQREVRQC